MVYFWHPPSSFASFSGKKCFFFQKEVLLFFPVFFIFDTPHCFRTELFLKNSTFSKQWGVSKIRKTRKKRYTSFRKKKYIFFEKDAKLVGGVSKIAPTDQKDANLVLGYFKSIRLVYGRCERIWVWMSVWMMQFEKGEEFGCGEDFKRIKNWKLISALLEAYQYIHTSKN